MLMYLHVDSGALYMWGTGVSTHRISLPQLVSLPAPVLSLACGSTHVIVITQHDTEAPRTWSWGANTYGQCGLQHVKHVSTPTEIKMDAGE